MKYNLHPRPEDHRLRIAGQAGLNTTTGRASGRGGRRKHSFRLHPTAQVRGLNRKRNPFLVCRFNWWGKQGEERASEFFLAFDDKAGHNFVGQSEFILYTQINHGTIY